MCWSLAPKRSRNSLENRCSATSQKSNYSHGHRILKALPNKTMGCRNKMTVGVTCTDFNLFIAFNYLTMDNQLQVLMVPVLHWRQFSCRSSEGGSTLLPEEQMHFAFSCPVYLRYSNLGQRGRTEGQINSSASSCHCLLPATTFFQWREECEPRSLLGLWPFIQPSACTFNGEPEKRRQILDQRSCPGKVQLESS